MGMYGLRNVAIKIAPWERKTEKGVNNAPWRVGLETVPRLDPKYRGLK